jgi:hypothetical protein
LFIFPRIWNNFIYIKGSLFCGGCEMNYDDSLIQKKTLWGFVVIDFPIWKIILILLSIFSICETRICWLHRSVHEFGCVSLNYISLIFKSKILHAPRREAPQTGESEIHINFLSLCLPFKEMTFTSPFFHFPLCLFLRNRYCFTTE